MAITRVKTSSILQNFPKERSMLAGNDGDTGAYESIATVLVGSGGTTNVEFTNIPSTFQHLQIRIIGRNTHTQSGDYFKMQFNSDTGSNYTYHALFGDGSTVTAAGLSNQTAMYPQRVSTTQENTNVFGAIIIDVLDYANANKNKIIRSLGGYDNNGNGRIYLVSGAWLNTNAVTSIKLSIGDASSINQHSHFALYGIR